MRDQGCGSGKSVVFIRNQVGRIVIREDGCGSEKSLGQIHLQPMDCDPGEGLGNREIAWIHQKPQDCDLGAAVDPGSGLPWEKPRDGDPGAW